MNAIRYILLAGLMPGPLTFSFALALAGEPHSLWFWRDVAGFL